MSSFWLEHWQRQPRIRAVLRTQRTKICYANPKLRVDASENKTVIIYAFEADVYDDGLTLDNVTYYLKTDGAFMEVHESDKVSSDGYKYYNETFEFGYYVEFKVTFKYKEFEREWSSEAGTYMAPPAITADKIMIEFKYYNTTRMRQELDVDVTIMLSENKVGKTTPLSNIGDLKSKYEYLNLMIEVISKDGSAVSEKEWSINANGDDKVTRVTKDSTTYMVYTFTIRNSESVLEKGEECKIKITSSGDKYSNTYEGGSLVLSTKMGTDYSGGIKSGAAGRAVSLTTIVTSCLLAYLFAE